MITALEAKQGDLLQSQLISDFNCQVSWKTPFSCAVWKKWRLADFTTHGEKFELRPQSTEPT